MELYGPSQSEAVPDASPLEPRESYLLSRLETPVEVHEGSLKVSQGFLGCTLGCLVHPWEVVLLQGVEEPVLLHGVSEPVVSLIVPVLFDPLFETPVVSKTSHSCMLSKVRPLDVVGVQFIPVSLLNQHSGSVFGHMGGF